jgi:hypothetical protein
MLGTISIEPSPVDIDIDAGRGCRGPLAGRQVAAMLRGGLLGWLLAVPSCVSGDVVAAHPFANDASVANPAIPAKPANAANGVSREAGSNTIEANAYYGIPILQKSFFWDGNAEVDDAGIGVHLSHYVADNLAFGLGTVYATWFTPGHNVYSGEVEAVVRGYPFGDTSPFFIDGNTGFQYASDHIPPGGTYWNFSFGFGGGVDVPLESGVSMLIGAHYHHISNALGRDTPRNPSQNECRIWVGFIWNF